jgi:hypothetical protein
MDQKGQKMETSPGWPRKIFVSDVFHKNIIFNDDNVSVIDVFIK